MTSGQTISFIRNRDGAQINVYFTSNGDNQGGWGTALMGDQLRYSIVFSSPIDIALDLASWRVLNEVEDMSAQAAIKVSVSGGTATTSSFLFQPALGGATYNPSAGVISFNSTNGTADFAALLPGTGTATTFTGTASGVRANGWDFVDFRFNLKGFTKVIPEPSSTALLGFAALGLITRRKR